MGDDMSKDQYNIWLNYKGLDASIKKELEAMNEQQIAEAFDGNLAFGTAGMRGLLGAGTNRMNIYIVRKATLGYATYLLENVKDCKERGIAIAFDNRFMSKEFAVESARLLASKGIPSYMFETLRPTPELSFTVRSKNCVGGIMITASHNPKEYNGYKLYDELGGQLVPAIADAVVAKVNAIEDPLAITIDDSTVDTSIMHIVGEEVDEDYYRHVLGIRFDEQPQSDISVVFSPEHGTANIPVQEVMKRAGYKCILVEEQSTPDPAFSNTITPNPEDPRAYILALEYAEKTKADLILVCDPDADRMGVGALHEGKYQLLSGNQSGALLAYYIFTRMGENNTMPKNPVMCNTVVTSDLGERVADYFGVRTIKTLTGFKFIAEKIDGFEKSGDKNYVYGYEESYGSLISPFVRDKDAPQACLMLMEACAYYKKQGKTLFDIMNEMYEKFGYYVDEQVSISLEGLDGAKKLNKLMSNLRTTKISEIANFGVVKVEDFELQQVETDKIESLTGFVKSNVRKYYLEDGSWIAVRPSGTEPKCKIYYNVKGESELNAKEKLEKIKESFEKEL